MSLKLLIECRVLIISSIENWENPSMRRSEKNSKRIGCEGWWMVWHILYKKKSSTPRKKRVNVDPSLILEWWSNEQQHYPQTRIHLFHLCICWVLKYWLNMHPEDKHNRTSGCRDAHSEVDSNWIGMWRAGGEGLNTRVNKA